MMLKGIMPTHLQHYSFLLLPSMPSLLGVSIIDTAVCQFLSLYRAKYTNMETTKRPDVVCHLTVVKSDNLTT